MGRYGLAHRADEVALLLGMAAFRVLVAVLAGALVVVTAVGRGAVALGWQVLTLIGAVDLVMAPTSPNNSGTDTSSGSDERDVIHAVAVRLPVHATIGRNTQR